MQAPNTIGSWSEADLMRVIRESIERLLPDHIPGLTVDDLIVAGSLDVRGKSDFNRQVIGVGAAGAPDFANSWANYGSPYAPAAYWKDQDGLVWLEGTIKSGTLGDAAFPLPPGYWPDMDRYFPAHSNGVLGLVHVTSGGLVIPISTGSASNASYTLDGITFRTGKS